MKKSLLLSFVLLGIPFLTLAQFGGVDTFFNNISTFINGVLIPLVFGIALLVFLYGMFQHFILGGASDDARAKGRQLIIWSIVAFVLMTSIWGIVNMISGGLFPDKTGPTIPSSADLRSR